MRLYDTAGKRLYLTAEERALFLAAAAQCDVPQRLFAETLHYTGCRISEALELTPERIDLGGDQVIFRSLKKRRSDVYRAVPAPSGYLDRLDMAFGIRKAQKRKAAKAARLWTWTRQRGWQVIKAIMQDAKIAPGSHRSPKGLRHAYGINATTKGVQLHMLKKWMGHASIETTAIYADAIGEEEQEIAGRMWE